MRLRTRLLLLTAVSTLPFLAALPWALRVVESAFERELDTRLDRSAAALSASLTDLAMGVRRTAQELANQADIAELARGLQAGTLEPADVVGAAGPLMAVSGLDALELLDADGRILSSGHLPARAGDPDAEALALAQARPGRPTVHAIEVATDAGIAPALAMVAALPAKDGGGVVVAVGRVIGLAWARHVAELTGADVVVERGEEEIARTGTPKAPRSREITLSDGRRKLGRVRVELSAEGLAATRARLVRGAVLLWAALLAAALALGLVLAARISRPVDALAQGARALAAGELGREVHARASGEVAELVEAFNAMSRGLKAATERVTAAERVAAWQGVARRLAHEIKNPLTPIRMSVETLVAAHRAKRADFDAIFAEAAGAVLEEVERLRRIVDEFSRFARLPKPRLAAEDLSGIVESVLALYHAPREGVAIERALAPGLSVEADRDQIAQVLINLLNNAEQALPGAGRIHVRTGRADGAPFVEIEDEGKGIGPAERSRLFEPYFTTKEGGTGLGLAIALRIAQEHGGRLEEVGRPGAGACFRLTLPRPAAGRLPES